MLVDLVASLGDALDEVDDDQNAKKRTGEPPHILDRSYRGSTHHGRENEEDAFTDHGHNNRRVGLGDEAEGGKDSLRLKCYR